MKIIVTTFLFSLMFFSKAQNREQITVLIEENGKNFDQVRTEYFEKLRKNDFFVYNIKKGGFRTYINKKKYDSLVRKNIPDSIVIKNSIFSIGKDNGEHYVYEVRAPDGSSNYLYKYKNNRIIAEYYWGRDALKGYYFKDFINLISITVQIESNPFKKNVSYTKFAKIDPENEYGFSDFTYMLAYDNNGKFKEWFPLKDFTMTEKEVFKHLLANFPDQSVELMKNIKYARKYGDTEKKFDYKDAKYELSVFKGCRGFLIRDQLINYL